MKKNTLTILSFLFVFSFAFATDNKEKELEIQTEGYIVTVLDFRDGDEIKLFEAETGVHILSKTRDYIDLSQLPNGLYVIENANGKSTTIERTEIELYVAPPLDSSYIVTEDASEKTEDEETLEELSLLKNRQAIDIKQEGNIITVLNFEEGDVIKLFEIKNTVHVLTKSTGVIDLTLLEPGKYFIENKKGAVAFIEKLANEEEQNTVKTSYLYASN